MRNARPPLAVFLGLAIALFWLSLSQLGWLSRPEWFCYHALFELRGPLERPSNLSLVAIDEASLQDIGVWPPKRTIYATLIDALLGAGARVVALDVVFPQAQSPDTDAAFAAAIARHPGRVVLAANFQPIADGRAEGEELLLPLASLRPHALTGYVNLNFDADGAIHRFVPFHHVELAGTGPWLDSFDVAIARAMGGLPAEIENTRHATLINYGGPPGHFQTVSLSDVLDAAAHHDTAFLSRFKGQAVLVGATSLRLQDQYPTPFTTATLGHGSAVYMPGVEIHANVVETLLSGNWIHEAPLWVQAALLILLGVAGAWLLALLPPWWGALAVLAMAAGIATLCAEVFVVGRTWLDPAVPLFTLGTLYASAIVQHFAIAEFKRSFTRRTFERYVSPEIVEELLRNPGLAPRLGGEKREVTVLFADIRSFTTISESLPPEAVVEFLNVYFTEMTEVIRGRHRGCIDKYIGDAILAVWGNVAPLSPEESARLGVRAALEMKARVEALREQWVARGLPRIAIGIGVNTGEAVVGNIGSPDKLEFAVIGDSINVASRLEGLTKDYDGALLVSGRTRELLGEAFDCTYLDTVKVKGRAQPVPIYRVDGERRVVRQATGEPLPTKQG
ncbi:MAG TPA: adenylate/guanylate cyclase domain-containing protein [Oscillatoriaceae cyanobacterium]